MSVRPQNAGLSWIPLCKYTHSKSALRVDNSNSKSKEIAKLEIDKKVESLPLTNKSNRSLRKDVVVPKDGLHLPSDLGFSINRFNDYLDDKDGQKIVMKEVNSGNKKIIDQNHRFEKKARKKTMAKFYATEREAINEYGEDNLKTVMLTLSASPFDEGGNLIPIVDHLDSMVDKDDGSWASVKSSLHRVLDGYEWEYMRILEPHTPDKGMYATAGYCHQHIALMIKDENDTLRESDFKKPLQSHVSNCDTAGKSAHTVSNSVSMVEYDENEEGGLGAYLTAYMGKQLDEDARNVERWFKRFLTMLWASNRRRVSFSQGANEWIKSDREDSGGIDYETVDYMDLDADEKEDYLGWVFSKVMDEWVMSGLKLSNGEIIEVDGANKSGSYLRDTELPPDMDKYKRRLLSLPGEI